MRMGGLREVLGRVAEIGGPAGRRGQGRGVSPAGAGRRGGGRFLTTTGATGNKGEKAVGASLSLLSWL